MTTITITRNDEGKIVGWGMRSQRAWQRLVGLVRALECGEILQISYSFPRSGPFHRMHFKMLTRVFEEQEQFDFKALRYWLQIGAGHARFVPGPDGRMVAMPESISYEKLDDQEMREHHEKVKEFLRSERAQNFLWPLIPPDEQMNKVDSILKEFERADQTARAALPEPTHPRLRARGGMYDAQPELQRQPGNRRVVPQQLPGARQGGRAQES